MNETDMMHGADWLGDDLAGFVLSEKFDGCRAYWDGEALWSRGGIKAQIPQEWADNLPAIPLDCELYDGIGGLSRCGSALRYGRFAASMRLMVFDAPAATGDYSDRMRIAADAVRGSGVAIAAQLTICRDTDHAIDLLRKIKACGGEGLVARHPGIQYAPGRTRQILKVKSELSRANRF